MLRLTQQQLFLAVIIGSNRHGEALVTEIYPVIESNSLSVDYSMNIPLDDIGPYSDTQAATFTFNIESADVVTTQNQQPDTLYSNMTTGVCSVDILTITSVTQDQAQDILLSNMTTGTCSAIVI